MNLRRSLITYVLKIAYCVMENGLMCFNKINGRLLRKIFLSFRMGYIVVLLGVLSYFIYKFISST